MSSIRDPSGSTLGITLTETAADAAREVLDEAGSDPAETGLRVIAREKDCDCGDVAYGLELESQPRSEDVTTEEHGIRLVVDERSTEFLEDVTLDYIDDFRGEGFTIESPNAGCGCGH